MRRMSSDELVALKQAQRATWALGDYGEVALRELWEVGARLVSRVGIAPGDDVLDVACGTGNVAIRAAEAGARVTGLDLTPELFDTGRRLAADARVEIEWVEGDAEALPFQDESFDVVLSTFGCMFAPRHELVAAEIARVLRPGGRLGICSWTPEGAVGRFLTEAAMPQLPEFVSAPARWGTESHVVRLFDGAGIDLAFERDVCPDYEYDSTGEQVEWLTTHFGPLMRVRQAAEEDGNWPEVRDQLAQTFGDGVPSEYLVALGRKAAR
jgi:SAM-dependent methyltransferase